MVAHAEIRDRVADARRAVADARRVVAEHGDDETLGRTLDELAATVELLGAAGDELQHENRDLSATRERVAARERAYRRLFELAPDPYVVTDLDGRIEEANGAAADLLDMTTAQLHGRELAGLVEPGTRDRFLARLRGLRDQGHVRGWELAVRPHRGPSIIVQANVAAAPDDGSAPESLHWVMRDVTDSRRAQQSLQEALTERDERFEQLRELDRWKDAFLMAAAHDVRAPLAVIRSAAETVAVRAADRETTERMAQMIIGQSERLGKLLSDLLDLDRFTRTTVNAERSPVEVRGLVEDAVGALPLSDHQVTVVGDPLTVPLDGARVRQIVENLVQNAATHTAPGTPIHVEVARDRDGVVIVVEDEGPGVPDEVADGLFLPFVTAPTHHGDTGGTGIGLALVRLFAELHGGGVRHEHRAGGGTRFVVELPGRIG